MKKTRLLIAMLLMLVAASGHAQDSYRQAVKDYLTANDQFEKTKSIISSMGMLFDGKGQVDIDQLTQRYLDEQYEKDMLDCFVLQMTEKGVSEADLKEVVSLLTSPAGKAYQEHQQEWLSELLADMMLPLMAMSQDVVDAEDPYAELESVMAIVEPRADIDASYAEKFKNTIMESTFVKNMTDQIMAGYENDTVSDPDEQKYHDFFAKWWKSSLPAIFLNSAYGTLTPEDLDYAGMLYSNDAFCRLGDLGNLDRDAGQWGDVLVKYMEWMEEQGATPSEDPGVAMEFLKSIFASSGIDLFGTEEEAPEKSWFDMDLEDLGRGK